MTAKQRKTLPAHEPIHEEIYQDFLVQYGYNTQPKMEKVNRAWLTYFHVENTVKNRDALRKRMEHLHPNKATCSPEKNQNLPRDMRLGRNSLSPIKMTIEAVTDNG